MSQEAKSTEMTIASEILFSDVMDKHLAAFGMNKEQFVSVSYQTFLREPKLLQCTRLSLQKVFIDAAKIGLLVDNRDAYIIPFWNRDMKCFEASLMPDYKGLMKIGMKNGAVMSWSAQEVCENDYFMWENGVIDHKIDYKKPRGKLILTYSRVKLANGEIDPEVRTLEEIEAARRRAKSDKFWASHYVKMARKVAVHSHAARLYLGANSEAMKQALAIDGDNYYSTVEPEMIDGQKNDGVESNVIKLETQSQNGFFIHNESQVKPLKIEIIQKQEPKAEEDTDISNKIISRSDSDSLIELLFKADDLIAAKANLSVFLKNELKVNKIQQVKQKDFERVKKFLS